MPKAKFKRKGAPPDALIKLENEIKQRKLNISEVICNQNVSEPKSTLKETSSDNESSGSILQLPEEMICMILQHLPGTACAHDHL